MRRCLPALTTAMLAATLVASCTTDTAGGATPSGSTTSAAASSSSSGVPKVETPLNTDHYLQAPCDALTQAQVDAIFGPGVTPEAEVDAPSGPACLLDRGDPDKGSINLGFVAKGLSRIYNGRGTAFKLFRPMDAIQGYPTVAYDTTDNSMTRGECAVAVGTSDTSTIDLGIGLTKESVGHKDACDSAYQVATTIIGNIKGGN